QSDLPGNLSLSDLPKARPRFVEPMKPKLVEHPPTAGDWIYELKFDGIRALAIKDGRAAQLVSRNEKKLNDRFPEIARAAAGDEAAWHGGAARAATPFRVRTRAPRRGLDQIDMPERAGICHRRLHSAGRRARTLRRLAGRLL